jgi:hypothetical protein
LPRSAAQKPWPCRQGTCSSIHRKSLCRPGFRRNASRPDADAERKLLYEDPDLHFCILAHVYKGAKSSSPHDHGPSWAIYGQAVGVTEMTDWRFVEKPANGQPGKVAKIRTYKMTPGVAHLYGEGVLHSPRRETDTRLIRIEGIDLTKVKRDKFEIAA